MNALSLFDELPQEIILWGDYAKTLSFDETNLIKQVMWSPNMIEQQHARKTHSYFLVFRKNAKMRDQIQKAREINHD